jgi:large subunit ribosomal protein L19
MSDDVKKEEKVEETQATPETTEKVVEETPAEEPVKEEAPAKETTEEAPAEETPAEEATEETKEEKKEEVKAEMPYKAKLEHCTDLKPGMTVRVHERIKDVSPKGEERERIQIFEGMILWLKSSGMARTITVRKNSKGFGVEKIYPINSPVVSKIELVKQAKVRRAKLGYLKDLKKRFKRRLKETRVAQANKGKKRKRR